MKEKIQNGMLFLRRYWQRPQRGDSVAYKEIAGFSVGGIGVKTFASLMQYANLTAQCLLISVVYGLGVRDIMTLFIITNIISVIKTPIVSYLVDNTDTPIGKFRPYMIYAGLPCILAVIGLTWCVPTTADMLTKCILIGIFFNLLSIFQPLLNNAYMGISQVISPNSGERTKIMGFSEFLGNLGPSIIQFALPTIGMLFFGETAMRNIWTYRILMPLFAIIGFALGLLVMYTTQERVVMPKLKKQRVKFFEGFALLCRNKEFWIVTICKFFEGFKSVLTQLLPWLCAYQLGNDGILGIVQTITSIGFTPGIILAPFLIMWLGSRGSALLAHGLNVVAALIMLFTFKSGFWVFVVALFFFNFALGPQYIIQNTIMSDGFDNQQNKLGVRIEGFAQNFQAMVATLGLILSTVVFTWIYEGAGLVADATTGETDYSILSNAAVRDPMIEKIIIIVIIASALATIPYIFITLNKKKMTIIKESLEKKKVIADSGLENASEEEQEKAYAAFLAEKDAEAQAANELVAKEKADLEAKQKLEKEALDSYNKELEEIKASIIANGGSEKEASVAIKAKKKERKTQLKEQRKQSFAKLVADQKALKERKKVFVAEWKANALAEYEQNKKQAKIDIANATAQFETQMAELNEKAINKATLNLTAKDITAEKKQITATKKEAISNAKYKAKNIKIWLGVLAREAFSRLLAEEAMNVVEESDNDKIVEQELENVQNVIEDAGKILQATATLQNNATTNQVEAVDTEEIPEK